MTHMPLSIYVTGLIPSGEEPDLSAFESAVNRLSSYGHKAVSPAYYYQFRHQQAHDPGSISWGLQQVEEANGIYLLPGWERSAIARAELAAAAALGKWARGAGDNDWEPASQFASRFGCMVLSMADTATISELVDELERLCEPAEEFVAEGSGDLRSTGTRVPVGRVRDVVTRMRETFAVQQDLDTL